MLQETDYLMSYFDNGEDFGGDSDDNMDEAIYWNVNLCIMQTNRPAACKHETGPESRFIRFWCVKHGHLKIQVDSAATFSMFFKVFSFFLYVFVVETVELSHFLF